MGTNYYLHRNVCHECGRSDEPLHIGKSSWGWCFALHVIPEQGINDLPDWIREFDKYDGVIKDESGTIISHQDMLKKITERKGDEDWDNRKWGGWFGTKEMSETEFHQRNHSLRGPKGLLRHNPTSTGFRRVSHGVGTWDLIEGEFA